MEIPTLAPCPCGKCKKVVVKPYFYGEDSSLPLEEAQQIVKAFEDAARWAYIKKHPMALRVLQYQLLGERDGWVDEKIAKEKALQA